MRTGRPIAGPPEPRRADRSEPALACPNAPAAALGARGLARGPVVRPSAASAGVTAAERRPRRPLAGLADLQHAAAELRAVEAVDGLGHCGCVAELHEGEAAGAIRHAVDGQDHLDDLTDLGEERLELLGRRFVLQISDEDS